VTVPGSAELVNGPLPWSAHRVTRFALALIALSWTLAAGAESERRTIVAYVDRDDDDDDGVADGSAPRVSGAAKTDVVVLSPVARVGRVDGRLVRLLAGDKPWSGSGRAPAELGLQGLEPGSLQIELDRELVSVHVLEAMLIDGRGERVDLARSHASLSRELPRLDPNATTRATDADALRWVLSGPLESLPDSVSLIATRPDGSVLDRLDRLALAPIGCPPGLGADLACRATPTVRAVPDPIDPRTRSSEVLSAVVGGRITLAALGHKAQSVRVGGPRLTAVGPIERLRAKLRVHVIRSSRGGMPAMGGDAAGAREIARLEVERTAGLWGQCGIQFGPPNELDIAVRDPPPSYLLAVGCQGGTPASGGEIRFDVAGRRVRVATRAGETPIEVAGALARALERAGFAATVSTNPRSQSSPLATADVLVQRLGGELVEVGADGILPLSTDPSLPVCLGVVDLADGLEHFSNTDAAAGTIEERALVKAYEDRDPTTIDVFVVPAFAGSGRIGESFIDAPGASIQNVVIVDRAAIRLGTRSFALAHELGHVILDLPGHPDDYGVDSPNLLMDADATDASIFGPRRLTVADCEQAVRQSGSGASTPLLRAWPMTHVGH